MPVLDHSAVAPHGGVRLPSKATHPVIAVLLILVSFPLLAVFGIAFLVYRLSLAVTMWTAWSTKGKDVLLVTSDSPVWSGYIAEHWIPRLEGRAVILNRSRSDQWGCLARRVFYGYGGTRKHTPLIVVFRPFRRSRVFRFWQEFRDFKHGDGVSLQKAETEAWAFLRLPPDPSR